MDIEFKFEIKTENEKFVQDEQIEVKTVDGEVLKGTLYDADCYTLSISRNNTIEEYDYEEIESIKHFL